MFTYYDYDQILSYNATYNVIVDSRGSGKTYGIKEKSVSAFFKNREQFFYIRRYKEESQKSAATFFNDIAHLYPFADFRTQGGFAQCASVETRGTKGREWDTLGHFGALSVGQKFKSTAYPEVTRLIYDEFIIEVGNTLYLRDEVTKFNNFYSTIDRNNGRCKAFLLANAVSMNNPFFIEWRVRPDEGKEFHKLAKVNGKWFVVVHFPEGAKYKAEVSATAFGQFLAQTSPEYLDYAVNNIFEDAHTELVRAKPGSATYRFSVDADVGTFSVWYDPRSGNFFVQRKRPRVETIFTLNRQRASPERTFIDYSSKVLSALRTAFNHGRVWFDEPSTRNAFIEVFKR